MRPIKAPAEHEPVLPAGTTLLVPVVGIDALNGRITDIAHRPERVQEVLKLSESITHLQPQDVAQLIVSEQGGLKNLPANARAYIHRLEEVVGAPIDIISTGPDRVETIVLRHPFA